MNQTAIGGRQIANGLMLYAMFRVLINSIIYAVILVFFGAIAWAAIPGVILLSMLLGLSWGFVFLAFSSHIKEESDLLILAMRFIVAPMFMFSGTFYELKNLPPLVQDIAWVSPLWHGTELARSLSYGSPDPFTLWHYVILISYGIIGAAFAYPQFMKRLSR